MQGVVDVSIDQNSQKNTLKIYPNPFSNNVTIEIPLLPGKDEAINIYNLNGELIRSFVNQTKTSGIHSFVWDGKNKSGKVVSSGVYYIKYRSGAQILTRPLVLLNSLPGDWQ